MTPGERQEHALQDQLRTHQEGTAHACVPGHQAQHPVTAAFRARLLADGKPRMVIVAAVMRKLVHIIF